MGALAGACVLALGLVAACDGGGGGGKNLASKAEVGGCQDSCDTQRFFDCYDASLQAGCYDDCSAASSDDINKFVGCVRGADFCDIECSTNIQGRSADIEPDERVDTGRDPVAPASSCQTACAAMAADMCIEADCSPLCADSEFSFAATYCNSVRNGCDFPAECTGGSSTTNSGNGAEGACLSGCDSLAFFDCASSSEQTACRTACGSADDTTRNNFSACASADICDASCLDILGVEQTGPTADVAGCRDTCDNLEFFDCLDAQGLSDCRGLCATATADSIETFKSCGEGLCDDDSCYQVLINAN